MNPATYQKIYTLLDRADLTPVEDGDFVPIKTQLLMDGFKVSDSEISQVYSRWLEKDTSVPTSSPIPTLPHLKKIDHIDMDDLTWKLETLEVEQSPGSRMASKNEFLPNPFLTPPTSPRGLEDVFEALTPTKGHTARAVGMSRPGTPRTVDIKNPREKRLSFAPTTPKPMLTGRRRPNLTLDIPYEEDSSPSPSGSPSPTRTPSSTSSLAPLIKPPSPKTPPKSILKNSPTVRPQSLLPPSMRPSTSGSDIAPRGSRFSELLSTKDKFHARPASSHSLFPSASARFYAHRSPEVSSSSDSSDELNKGKSKLFSMARPSKIFGMDLEKRKEEAAQVVRDSAKRHEDKVGERMKRFWARIKGQDDSLESETKRFIKGRGERLADDEEPSLSDLLKDSEPDVTPTATFPGGVVGHGRLRKEKKSVRFEPETVFKERVEKIKRASKQPSR